MNKSTQFVGLDVHSESIAVAVADYGGNVRSLGKIPNDPEAISKMMRKLGKPAELRVCYEAGPHGFVLFWQLTRAGIHCDVIAPTLVPVKAGDRVKTDRKDAEKLARCYRNGDLTPVWVPDAAHEALRDLVRAREAAKKDQLVARHRVGKFLLRHGQRRPAHCEAWGTKHMAWLRGLHFDDPTLQAVFSDYLEQVLGAAERISRLEREIDSAVDRAPEQLKVVVGALQALRGVKKITATTIVLEVGKLSRFSHPKQLMAYSGAVSCEDSTGNSVRRGRITKAGNAHLRRVLIEAAWAYRHGPSKSAASRKRQEGLPPEVQRIAREAERRLCQRYKRLIARGKLPQVAVVAIGRELLGFIWAIAAKVDLPA